MKIELYCYYASLNEYKIYPLEIFAEKKFSFLECETIISNRINKYNFKFEQHKIKITKT